MDLTIKIQVLVLIIILVITLLRDLFPTKSEILIKSAIVCAIIGCVVTFVGILFN